MPPVQTQNFLTIGEVARRSGLSVDTIRRYCSQGKLPYVRTPGGQRRFRAEDVDAMFDTGDAA